MKIFRYFTIAAVLVAGAVMTSCSSDFLEAEDKSSGGKSDDSFFSSSPESMLYTAYASLKDVVSTVDIYVQGTDLYVNNNNKLAGAFNDYSLDAKTSDVENFYLNNYIVINYANGVIGYSKGDTQYSQEARFVRAYCYYLLTQQFGSVPLVTEYIKTSNSNYPPTSLKNLYSFLTNDLEAVYNDCKLSDYNTKAVGRPSKQAVAALLAKIYLAAGWDCDVDAADDASNNGELPTPTSTENFTKAQEWATKAIEGGATSALGDFEALWKQENEDTNGEIIFSVQYDRANYPGTVSTGGHSLQNNFGGYYGSTTAYYIKNGGSNNSQSLKSMYLFEENDARYGTTFMTDVYNSTGTWGTEGYYAYYNASDLSSLAFNTKFFPWYSSEDEVDTYLREHKAQFQKGSYKAQPFATLLQSTVVLKTIDASGNIKTAKMTPDAYDNTASNTELGGVTLGSINVRKFDDKNSEMVDRNNDYRDIVLLQLSDMYLVRAEANMMLGGDYMSDINTVRSRAGLSALGSAADYQAPYATADNAPYSSFTVKPIDLLLDERARELYAQNMRWTDLRRTKQLVRYNVAFNKYINGSASAMMYNGAYKVLRPIPQKAKELNDGLKNYQNPGYPSTVSAEVETETETDATLE